MPRIVAILAIVAMGLPLLSAAWAPPAGAITIPPLLLPHHRAVIIDNFTGMQMTGLETTDDGSVRLADAGRIWGQLFPTTGYEDEARHMSMAGGVDNVFVLATTVTLKDGQTTQRDIQCQRYNNHGEMLGTLIPVCTNPKDQVSPAVAMTADGSFAVAWMDNRNGAATIYVQRFDAAGTKLGTEFNVTPTQYGKEAPAIAATPAGGYVLAWTDTRTGKPQIFACMIDKNGTSAGEDVQVTVGTAQVNRASIAVDSQGRIMIAYGIYSSTPNEDFAIQRLDAAGQRIGNPISIVGGTASRTAPQICAGPDDNYYIAWVDFRDYNATRTDIYGQKVDGTGSKVGSEMVISNDTVSEDYPRPAYDADGDLFVAWQSAEQSTYQVRAKFFSASGIGRPITRDVTDLSKRTFVVGLSADDRGDFMVAILERTDNGISLPSRGLARAFLATNVLSGALTTTVQAPPDAIHHWGTLSAQTALASQSANSVSFEYSTDGGGNWTAVPANNSLAAAGRSPLTIRAHLTSLDNLTTPVLENIILTYVYNHPPVVQPLADMSVKKGKNVTFLPNATDSDLLDSLGLTYRWSQTSGKNLTLVNASGPNLTFKADKAGTFAFRLVVSDGYNDSAPVTVAVKVTESKPAAKTGYEWALLVCAAAGIAALLRRRRI